jgi:hypothetical protein
MAMLSLLFIFVALRLLLVSGAPAPLPVPATDAAASSSSYWVANIARQGTVAYGTSGYQIFRNVQTFGAKGDGVTDDTVAINAAITAGTRCGQGCDSSTTTPALVYFPPGTYLISAPLVQLYYTQFVGDAVSVPTIKASAGFQGIALIDSDPYADGGVNWCMYILCFSTAFPHPHRIELFRHLSNAIFRAPSLKKKPLFLNLCQNFMLIYIQIRTKITSSVSRKSLGYDSFPLH